MIRLHKMVFTSIHQLLQENIRAHKHVFQCLKDLEKIVPLGDLVLIQDHEREALVYLIIKEKYLKLNQMKDLKNMLENPIKELV